MLAILVLYLAADKDSGGMDLPDTTSIGIVGVYSALIYLLTVPQRVDRRPCARPVQVGADRRLHHRLRPLRAGDSEQVSPGPGMALIAIGTGLLKPNISAMVGELYDRDPDEGSVATPGSPSSTWESTSAVSSRR